MLEDVSLESLASFTKAVGQQSARLYLERKSDREKRESWNTGTFNAAKAAREAERAPMLTLD
jgi:hypothetical protein